MIEILEFTFQSFWHFIGVLILMVIPIDALLKVFNRFFRHWNIRKHGYPPAHCDADGDFLTPTK